jgi:hypothetical protein
MFSAQLAADAAKGREKDKMYEEERREPEFYRVITDSMLVGQKIYKEGDLIPRGDAGFKFDYALGQGLIELYVPEDEQQSHLTGLRAFASRLALRARRA